MTITHIVIYIILWTCFFRREKGKVTPIKDQKKVSKYCQHPDFQVVCWTIFLHSVEAAGEDCCTLPATLFLSPGIHPILFHLVWFTFNYSPSMSLGPLTPNYALCTLKWVWMQFLTEWVHVICSLAFKCKLQGFHVLTTLLIIATCTFVLQLKISWLLLNDFELIFQCCKHGFGFLVCDLAGTSHFSTCKLYSYKYTHIVQNSVVLEWLIFAST